MTYATAADLTDRFGQDELIQLTDRNNTGLIDQAVLGRALADADAEIDGYLAARYALPLASVPPVITRLAADLARYQLFGDRLTEAVKNRRDNAVAFLQALSRGTVSIGLDQTSKPVADAGGVQITANKRVFNDVGLADY